MATNNGGAKFIRKFGEVLGSKYYVRGLSFDEAFTKFLADQASEIKRLKRKNTDLRRQLGLPPRGGEAADVFAPRFS